MKQALTMQPEEGMTTGNFSGSLSPPSHPTVAAVLALRLSLVTILRERHEQWEGWGLYRGAKHLNARKS